MRLSHYENWNEKNLEYFRTVEEPKQKWYRKWRFDSLLYYFGSFFVDEFFGWHERMCDFIVIECMAMIAPFLNGFLLSHLNTLNRVKKLYTKYKILRTEIGNTSININQILSHKTENNTDETESKQKQQQ